MSGDVHVRFCERLGVQLPRATHRNIYVRSRRAGQRVMASVTRFLTTRLSLTVNAAKSAVARPWELKLLPETGVKTLPQGAPPQRAQ
jgi:hypothetical protein